MQNHQRRGHLPWRTLCKKKGFVSKEIVMASNRTLHMLEVFTPLFRGTWVWNLRPTELLLSLTLRNCIFVILPFSSKREPIHLNRPPTLRCLGLRPPALWVLGNLQEPTVSKASHLQDVSNRFQCMYVLFIVTFLSSFPFCSWDLNLASPAFGLAFDFLDFDPFAPAVAAFNSAYGRSEGVLESPLSLLLFFSFGLRIYFNSS